MISLNGEPAAIAAGDSVVRALELLGLTASARGVAVAIDGEVVPRAEWDARQLQDGARIEVLTAMQGG